MSMLPTTVWVGGAVLAIGILQRKFPEPEKIDSQRVPGLDGNGCHRVADCLS